jgi:hypothetical protein
MIRKTLAVGLVLAAAVGAELYAQAIGTGIGPSFTQTRFGGAAASVLGLADSHWTFDDVADQGADSNGSNDLTLLNTPTPTGGALGTSMELVQASAQYATVADDPTLDSGTGDFGFCAWVRPDDVVTTGVAGKWTGGSREYRGHLLNQFYFTVRNAANTAQVNAIATDAGALLAGNRYFVCGYHDDSADLLWASTNNVANSAAFADTPRESTNAFEVGGILGADEFDGDMGPVFWYKGGLPPVSDLYAAGAGMDCEAAAAAGFDTNGVSCWNMDENGGPYVDSWGSNDLSGVNTPTQGSGLISRGDSGLAVEMVDGNNSYMNGNYALFASEQDYSQCEWQHESADSTTIVFGASLGNLSTAYTWNVAINSGVNAFQAIAYDSVSGTSNGQVTSFGTTDQWRLLCWGYQASSKKAWASVDGSAKAFGVALSNGLRLDSDYIWFARSASAGDTDFVGDQLTLWAGKELTAGEISDLWASGAGLWAAVWDTIFNGPRFAWSAPPELRRIEG